MENNSHLGNIGPLPVGVQIHSTSAGQIASLNLKLPEDQRLRDLIIESLSKTIRLTDIDGTNWIQDSIGHRYHFLYPEKATITIEDIASTLAKTCRFGGKTKRFYSVAEHLIIASYYPGLTPWMRMQTFAHDWHEAYLLDVTRPLKQLLPGYTYLCRICDEVLAEKFDCIDLLDPETVKIVKMVDSEMLRAETAQLMRGLIMDWQVFDDGSSNPSTGICKELQDRITCLPPKEAEEKFLVRYEELRNQIQPLPEIVNEA